MPALLTGSQGKEDARHAKDLGDLLVIPVLGNYVLPFAEPRGLQHTRLHPLKPAGGAGDPHALLSSWARSVFGAPLGVQGYLYLGKPPLAII